MTAPRPDVFCRDCAWYGGAVDGWHVCHHQHAWTIVKEADAPVLVRTPADIRNAGNACTDFTPARLWWVLWRRYGVRVAVVIITWALLATVLAVIEGWR